MKRPTFGRVARPAAGAALALTLVFGIGAASARPANGNTPAVKQVEPAKGYPTVDSFWLRTRLRSWTPIDSSKVIVWPTPFDPYLVELAYPSPDLKFANVIGLTSFADRVYAKFDAVRVRGFRYPIQNIYKLTREEAKSLEAAS